jgi:hypothetical protein
MAVARRNVPRSPAELGPQDLLNTLRQVRFAARETAKEGLPRRGYLKLIALLLR